MPLHLTHVEVAPKGMDLNDFVAFEEGFFAAEGLDVELDWKTLPGHPVELERPQVYGSARRFDLATDSHG